MGAMCEGMEKAVEQNFSTVHDKYPNATQEDMRAMFAYTYAEGGAVAPLPPLCKICRII